MLYGREYITQDLGLLKQCKIALLTIEKDINNQRCQSYNFQNNLASPPHIRTRDLDPDEQIENQDIRSWDESSRMIKVVTRMDRIRNHTNRNELNCESIFTFVENSQSRWFGYLMRMDESPCDVLQVDSGGKKIGSGIHHVYKSLSPKAGHMHSLLIKEFVKL